MAGEGHVPIPAGNDHREERNSQRVRIWIHTVVGLLEFGLVRKVRHLDD